MKRKLPKVLVLIAVAAAVTAVIIASKDSDQGETVSSAAGVNHNAIQKEENDAASFDNAKDSLRCVALPAMLELGSEGCISCEKMKPVMKSLIDEYGDLINIEFHDVRKNSEITQKYKIRLIPTQVFLKPDSTEFFRHEGFFPKEEIEKVFRDMGVPL
ncbi:MAG: thioredoxin family protein [Candidatus Electryonea clarkiae]|nr:thioredoxin family protein [Candidatus Electryonea clarkiae]MDP8286240.1 thioredoxin family protein [Candidatus Electryonea clarkiae]